MFTPQAAIRIDEGVTNGWMPPADVAAAASGVRPLGRAETREALAFLAARPLHTVILASLIRDNGIESPLNRGTFYGCRDRVGRLEGVALIGHATLLETRTARALEAFARTAQDTSRTHMVLGERERVAEFWEGYRSAGQELRLACRELLFELKSPAVTPAGVGVEGLRLATLADLDLVAPVQDELAFAESGVHPLEVDREGFRLRCARRIGQGRTWVKTEAGRVVFKAEVQSETERVVYLEGIYVAPEARGRGLGLDCLSQLCRQMLARVPSVCLLVNVKNREAHALYRRAGFTQAGVYDTIFLEQEIG